MDIRSRIPVVELRTLHSRVAESGVSRNPGLFEFWQSFHPRHFDPLQPPPFIPTPTIPLRQPLPGVEPSRGLRRALREAEHEAKREELSASRPPALFTLFRNLPEYICRKVWEELMRPSRIIVVESVTAYELQPHMHPSSYIPQLYQVSPYTSDMISDFGIPLRFSNADKAVHYEWYDRLRDMLYIPSIRVFESWMGWDDALVGATVITNLLEMVEDEFRGEEPSAVFNELVREGRFDRVRAFRLAMLTVTFDGDSWEDELNIYEEDDLVAMVDLDDKRLPQLLRPVFQELREFGLELTHKRPSCLLKHLHKEWDTSLKFLFEEQWLRAQLQMSYDNANPEIRDNVFNNVLLNDVRFGYRRRRRATNREDDFVHGFVRKMPDIRPVIVFERQGRPDDIGDRTPRNTSWNRGRHRDGLISVSNRRRMSLSPYIRTGRVSIFG